MNEIRLGTIGSGSIVHAVLDGMMKAENLRLEAVYSRSWEKGEKLAKEYGAQKVYTSLEEMFADEEVNTVYIASPNILHYEQSKMALLAGKHVICEKPFCTRKEQALELIALAKEKGLYLVDATPTCYLPNLPILKRELHKAGRIKLVQSNYSQYSSRYDQLLNGEVTNVFNPEFAGGCLMDINYYNVYLMITLFGKPVEAVYYPNIYEDLVDTSGILVMKYEDFVVECTGAKDTWGVNFMAVEGEKGYLYCNGGCNGIGEIQVITKTTKETFNEQDGGDLRHYEAVKIPELMLKGDTETFEKGLAVMTDVIEIIENARKAAGIIFPGDSL